MSPTGTTPCGEGMPFYGSSLSITHEINGSARQYPLKELTSDLVSLFESG